MIYYWPCENMNQFDEYYWREVSYLPSKPGRYLVIQETDDYKRYRWIRYFDGSEWTNTAVEKYGKITYWTVLPCWP